MVEQTMWKTHGSESNKGCVHDYLGITFRFIDEKVKIDVVEFIPNMLREFPAKFKEVNGNVMDLFSKDEQ